MLTCLTYLWHSPGSEYSVGDVYLLKSMVDRNLTIPHQWVCATDRPRDFDSTIRTIPIEPLTHIAGRIFDRVELFRPDLAQRIGQRVLAFDLDCVVTGNLDAIAGRPEPLVLWKNPTRVPWDKPEGKSAARSRWNTSLMLASAGVAPQVWHEWRNGKNYPAIYRGDQYLFSDCFPEAPHWDQSHGVYRYARDDGLEHGVRETLPDNARIVFFPGSEGKLSLPHVRETAKWVAEYHHGNPAPEPRHAA